MSSSRCVRYSCIREGHACIDCQPSQDQNPMVHTQPTLTESGHMFWDPLKAHISYYSPLKTPSVQQFLLALTVSKCPHLNEAVCVFVFSIWAFPQQLLLVTEDICPPPGLPRECVCGSKLNMERALSCPTGGVTISRHNMVRNLLAGLLTDACHNVPNNNCNSTRIQTLWFLKQVLKCSSSWTQHYLWWK